jgi:hypothetical protein
LLDPNKRCTSSPIGKAFNVGAHNSDSSLAQVRNFGTTKISAPDLRIVLILRSMRGLLFEAKIYHPNIKQLHSRICMAIKMLNDSEFKQRDFKNALY